jgi:predicted O-methyltransferase YrrM
VLADVPLPPSATKPDAATAAFLSDAAARIDAFFEARWQDPIVGFVPSDFSRVWPVLAALVERDLAPGRLFCEWGCGFGVVAGLAAKLGFAAHGIEIEPDLVREAQRLLADHRLDAKIVAGSFIPPGGEALAEIRAEMAWLVTGGADGHAALRRSADEWDVVFAYPWPGEEHVVERLFERYAAPRALLVTHRSEQGTRVQRKAAERGRGRRREP